MKRIIVDYKKLTPEVLNLLTEKFPDGYGDDDIITFENHRNEIIEAIEVKTPDAIYLVKVSSKLHYTMTNFDNDNIEVDDLGNVVVDDAIEPTIFEDEEE
ncbi:hypothetical protein [Hwangdonia lutea]|uniref:DNA primase n=1 Tax=Hwangdonia lutea TaxID=3075823 RepID=A0AA97HQV1_9FLAO|nr:hypothetical protein [Hwangdonia sp. SCSIO 19198]WOD43350.1 hypothetical protein RNZ46_15275 [Hwangdonia sp. SCSIO 19198]